MSVCYMYKGLLLVIYMNCYFVNSGVHSFDSWFIPWTFLVNTCDNSLLLWVGNSCLCFFFNFHKTF